MVDGKQFSFDDVYTIKAPKAHKVYTVWTVYILSMCIIMIDSPYFRWNLWGDDGVLYGTSDHTLPDKDEHAQITAAMNIGRRTGRRVAEWLREEHRDGSPQYRAVLSTEDGPAPS